MIYKTPFGRIIRNSPSIATLPADIFSVITEPIMSIKVPYGFPGTIKIKIEKVTFTDKATVVSWSDGTYTKSICQDNEVFDAEKGLAIAIAKKFMFMTGIKSTQKEFDKFINDTNNYKLPKKKKKELQEQEQEQENNSEE